MLVVTKLYGWLTKREFAPPSRLAHPAFVRPPPACPAPTTSPTQPAGRAPARPQPPDPPSRHPPDPVAQRPTVSCPRPTVPPCPPAPVRPSSAPGLSAWLPLRPPSPSHKGGFVVTTKDRNKDAFFQRNFSQLPQLIQDQYPKAKTTEKTTDGQRGGRER